MEKELNLEEIADRFSEASEKLHGLKGADTAVIRSIESDVLAVIIHAETHNTKSNLQSADNTVNLMASYAEAEQRVEKAEQKAGFYREVKNFHKGLATKFRNEAEDSKAEAAHNKALLGTDKLTGIPNRAAFDEQLATAVEQNGQEASTVARGQHGAAPEGHKNYFALVMVDLDRFKGLNDDHGHDAGDVALQTFASRLQTVVRGDKDEFFGGRSRISRLGGDEFSIIMNAQAETREDAMKQFEPGLARINRELEGTYSQHNTKSFPIVATLGMHVLEDGDTAKSAYSKADTASLAAKSDKIERYERAVALLEEQGVENIQIVEDKRAKEGLTPLSKGQLAAVAQALMDTGHINFASDDAIQDAVNALAVEKTLEAHGLEITYEDDKPQADSKHDGLDIT